MPTVENSLHRYPGPRPFESNETELFRGRSNDIKNLYELVSLQNLVVLYGRSGLGKSSLLNAGLSNHFKNEAGTIPRFIRFGAYNDKTRVTPFGKLYELVQKEQPVQPTNFIHEKLLAGEEMRESRLWSVFKDQQLAQSGNSQFVLIFDQFEELFTYPQHDIQLFKKELADLLYTSVPQQLRNGLKDKLRLDPHYLSEEEREALFSPLQIRLIFSIRSDKLSLLNYLTDYFPSLLKWCYELKPLQVEQARQAIEEPALLEGSQYITPPFRFTDDAIHLLLTSLTTARNIKDPVFADHAQEIETFQLQIVCKHTEDLVLEKGLRTVTAGDLGNIKAIFENHYRNIIDRLAPVTQLPARKLIEEKLIVDGSRVSMPVPVILKDAGMTSALLDELIGTHMLRREQNNTVELSHDTLIEPVLKYYEERKKEETVAAELRQKEEQINKIRQEQQQQLHEQRLQAKRNRVLIGVISAALVVSLGLGTYAFYKSLVADRQKAIADKQKEAAIRLQYRADSIARVAKSETENAIKSRRIAEEQSDKADRFADYAIEASTAASQQKRIAEISAERAAEQAQLARKALIEAETQKEIVAKNGKAFQLITQARQIAETNPTIALRIAEAAMQEKKDDLIEEEAGKLFDLHAFYKTIVNNYYAAHGTVFPDGRVFPDGSKLLLLTFSGGIEIRNTDGRLQKSIPSNPGFPYATAISPDGNRFVIGCADSAIRLYNLEGKIREFSNEPKTGVNSLAFDGKKIVAGFADSSICVWKTDGTLLSKFWSHETENTVSLSPDGTKILTGSIWSNPWLWNSDGRNGKELTDDSTRYSCGTFSSDGTKILIGNLDSTLRLFNTGRTLLKTFSTGSAVYSVAFSSDDTRILAGCVDGTARLFSVDGTLLKEFKGHDKAVSYVAFSPDQSMIYTSDGSIRKWNIEGIPLQEAQATTLNYSSMDFSPDASKVLIKGLSDSMKALMQLYNLAGKNRGAFTISDATATSMIFSVDGKAYLSGFDDGTIRLRNIDGSLLKEFSTGITGINVLAFSPDGSKIIAGHTHDYAYRVGVWTVEGKQLKTYEDHANAITKATFLPDGKKILISAENRHTGTHPTILFSLDGAPSKNFTHLTYAIHAMAFSKDGSQFIAGDISGTVKILDITGNILSDLTIGRGSVLNAAAFSPDNSKIISGYSGVARLWSREGKLLFEYKPRGAFFKGAAFSPDGQKVVLGLADGRVLTYKIVAPLDDLLKSDQIERLTQGQKEVFDIP